MKIIASASVGLRSAFALFTSGDLAERIGRVGTKAEGAALRMAESAAGDLSRRLSDLAELAKRRREGAVGDVRSLQPLPWLREQLADFADGELSDCAGDAAPWEVCDLYGLLERGIATEQSIAELFRTAASPTMVCLLYNDRVYAIFAPDGLFLSCCADDYVSYGDIHRVSCYWYLLEIEYSSNGEKRTLRRSCESPYISETIRTFLAALSTSRKKGASHAE